MSLKPASRLATNQVGQRPSRLSVFVAAGLGVLLATVWFVVSARAHHQAQVAAVEARLDAAAKLFAIHQGYEARRLGASAEMLAGDQRVRQTVLEAIDEPTLIDTFKDIQQADRNSLHAVLTPEGKVAAVVGANALKGIDLSSTALVRAALANEGAATSRWFIGGNLVEVAAAAVRQGPELKAIVVLGDAVSASTLSTFTAATGASIGLTSEGKVVAAYAALDDSAALASIASSGSSPTHSHREIELSTAMPPAKIVLLAKRQTADPSAPLRWVVLAGALAFAVFAVVRARR